MYLHWDKKIITDLSQINTDSLYDQGYVFTRLGKGIIHQTRSIRINLLAFDLSSENRRVLKKNDDLSAYVRPLPYTDYHWSIGKLAKDFYETKFGKGTMSANKIKELMTESDKSNFNCVFVYQKGNNTVGYCIAFETPELVHYSYPFYNREESIGMTMMTQAVVWAKEHGKKYIYLGSAQRPSDTYKLQFAGLQWFDGKTWTQDEDRLKKELSSAGEPTLDNE